MKTIFDNGAHKIQIPDNAVLGGSKEYRESAWIESELVRTDVLALRVDDPKNSAVLIYRQALYSYRDSPDFPNNERPTE